MPEFTLDIREDRVEKVRVSRGAPCGATWDAAEKICGLKVEKAIERIGLETQFFCTADPANWDPIYQKSPVHIAGRVHNQAFKKAVDDAMKI